MAVTYYMYQGIYVGGFRDAKNEIPKTVREIRLQFSTLIQR